MLHVEHRNDLLFMSWARRAAGQSRDRSTQTGCVIIGPAGQVCATGCNGFPHGVDDSREERHARPAKYLWTEHAERNAIYQAARAGVPLAGSHLYLPWFPCADCARAIIQAGIVEVVGYPPDLTHATWGPDFTVAVEMLAEAGISVRYMPDFCTACGASVPPKDGEGRCEYCDPVGVAKHVEQREQASQ